MFYATRAMLTQFLGNYWLFDAILFLFDVVLASFVGLWCIWGGLGRRHWFVRMSVVLGWISLLLVIPAYELVFQFLVQAGVTIVALWAWRAWRFSRRDTASDNDGSIWPFSIRDLLLLTILVAWVSAMLARAPVEIWASWLPLAVEGSVAAVFTLAAAWIALGAGRRWRRWIAFFMVFPSALMVAWLALARSARFTRPGATKTPRMALAARVGLVLMSLLIGLPTAALYWRLARPLPIPEVHLPNPNGYDDLVRAGKMLENVGVPDAGTATHAQLKSFVAQYSRAYDVVQVGLGKPSQVPLTWTIEDANWMLANNDGFRQIARILDAKAKLAELDGRTEDAAISYLDLIRLGKATGQDGLVIHWLVGITFEGMGHDGLCRLRKSLSAKQCHALIATMKYLVDCDPSLDESLVQEAVWADHAFGWIGRVYSTVKTLSRYEDTPLQNCFPIRDRNLAKSRLLICDLAIRVYSLERGHNPAALAELVPEYLKEVPEDPFSGGPLIYRVTPTGYLLYSIGVNRVDDGGWSGAGQPYEVGDILLD